MAKRPHPVNEVPMAYIRDEDRLRASRLFDPEFFPNLKNDGRKVAVLTLERGFLRVLANAQNGMPAIDLGLKSAKTHSYFTLPDWARSASSAAASFVRASLAWALTSRDAPVSSRRFKSPSTR